MGLATLFASLSFGKTRLEQAIRWLFIVDGVLGIGGIIGLAIGLNMKILYGELFVWDVVMPTAAVLLAIMFQIAQRKMASNTSRVSG